MLTLTSRSSLSRSSAIRARTGATAWHGPHHSAQKSTITGFSLLITSSSQVCSVTAVAMNPFLPPVPRPLNATGVPGLPALQSPDGGVLAAARGSRPSRARARGPRTLGGRADVRAAPRAEPRQAPLEVHGRADHGQQPGRRPPRARPDAEGRLPALQGAAGLRPAVPERLRLPGAPRRGGGREVARLEFEARDRGVRPRRIRAPLPRAGRALRVGADRAVETARHVD